MRPARCLLSWTVLLATPLLSPAAPATRPGEADLSALGDEILDRPNLPTAAAAVRRLNELGAAADPLVPRLAKGAIGDGTSQGRYRLERAIEALGMIGSPAALQALVPLMDDKEASSFATRAVICFGEPAIRPLEAAALRKPEVPRGDPIRAIYKIGGPRSAEALQRLSKKASLPENRDSAGRLALQLDNLSAGKLLPELRKGRFPNGNLAETGLTGMDTCLAMLGDPDPAVRRRAPGSVQQLLMHYGTFRREKQILPLLIAHRADIERGLTDSDASVFRVSKTLANLAGMDTTKAKWKPAPPPAIVARPLTRLEQLTKLAKEKGAAAEPELMQVIASDPDHDLRLRAADILLRIPPADERIDRALRSDISGLRLVAINARTAQGEPGWRKLLTALSTMEVSRYESMFLSGPDQTGVRVAMAVLDGDDPKLALPATVVLGTGFVPAGAGQVRPSDKAMTRMASLLADKDPERRAAVSRALMRMAAVASGPVLDLLQSPDADTRRIAAITLAGNDSVPAQHHLLPGSSLNALLAAANDPDPVVRENLAIALTRVCDLYDRRDHQLVAAPPDVRQPALAQLYKMLDDPDPDVRGTIVSYLARLTDGNIQLQQLRQHREPSVAKYAQHLYRVIFLRLPGLKAPPPRPIDELIAGLNAPANSGRAKETMANELGHYGVQAAAAIPTLSAQLDPQKRVNLRVCAAEALGLVGAGSPQAATALIGALDDPDPNVVAFALRAIGRVGPVAKGVLPRLAEIALRPRSDEEDQVMQWQRSSVLEALAGLGPAGVPTLITVMERGPASVREVAEQFQRIGPVAAPAVPTLIKLMQQAPTGATVEYLAKAIGAIGPAAKEAVPLLSARLQTADFNQRRVLTEALGDIWPAAATPQVIAVLTSPAEHGRPDADGFIALGKMGPAAAAAVPKLTEQIRAMLERRMQEKPGPGDTHTQTFGHAEQQAARALGKMGPKAAAALPTLQEALTLVTALDDKSSVAVVRQAQARILGKEPLDSPDDFGPIDPSPPSGPFENRDPNKSHPPPDLGGPFIPETLHGLP